MKTVVITLLQPIAGEAIEISRMLTSEGVWRVHIRKPGCTEEYMRKLIEQIPVELRRRISLHDCFELASEYGVGGLHLNSRNSILPQGWNGMVSRSIHSLADVSTITDDYAFLSPVFPSISKPGYVPMNSLDDYAGVVNDKIIALGGITGEKEQLAQLHKLGFGGVALMSAVWGGHVSLKSFRLQYITSESAKYSILEGARQAIAGGCRWVQLRMKNSSVNEILAVGAKLKEMCDATGTTLIIDDHVDVALTLGASGVHLGKNDMPVDEARSVLGRGFIIGATANTFHDVMAATKAGADYVGLGPFRFTETKKNLSPILGSDGIEEILAKCSDSNVRIPIVAIGGITMHDLPKILSTGVAGVAVSGDIVHSDNPQKQVSRYIDSIDGIFDEK